MKRRGFIQLLGLAGLAIGAAGRAGLRLFARAVPGRAYPGRVVRFSPDAARKQGRWLG